MMRRLLVAEDITQREYDKAIEIYKNQTGTKPDIICFINLDTNKITRAVIIQSHNTARGSYERN